MEKRTPTILSMDKKGFTLLELLIVISIIAILSVIIVLVLNPAEILRKSRDAQRISDLSTLKSALAIYTTSTSSPQLDGTSGTANDLCVGGATPKLWVSINTLGGGGTTITDATPPAAWTQAAATWIQSTSASAATLVDGTGWIPVNLASMTGGSPISNMPVDPTNNLVTTTGSDASTAAAVTNGALMYRYSCRKSTVAFEADARLESLAYGVGGADDRAAKDGGNNTLLFEMGTDLTILPSTNDF